MEAGQCKLGQGPYFVAAFLYPSIGFGDGASQLLEAGACGKSGALIVHVFVLLCETETPDLRFQAQKGWMGC
ncbi:hypothetical protein GY14_23685 [Delftia tsuruhatensis]|nr:hypothetical protein GY14_23685 [Delftia tsuruhatensis]